MIDIIEQIFAATLAAAREELARRERPHAPRDREMLAVLKAAHHLVSNDIGSLDRHVEFGVVEKVCRRHSGTDLAYLETLFWLIHNAFFGRYRSPERRLAHLGAAHDTEAVERMRFAALEVAKVYASTYSPGDLSGYRCSSCSADGVRLWRPYQTFADQCWAALLCRSCAEARLGNGDRDDITSDAIGWNVPAVPDGDETFWGFSSVPWDGELWWRALPEVRS